MSDAVRHYLLAGNAYIEGVGPDTGGIKELYSHRPDRVRVLVGDAVQPVRGYRYSANGQSHDWTADQILHWRAFHPLNDWYGMSRIEAAARSIDQNNESRTWNVALLQNSARPPGGFFSKEALTEEQYERLKAMVDERYAGSRNAGRPLLSEGGITWQEFGLTPVEMAWAAGLSLSMREICTVFGVPPELLGDTDAKTYASYEVGRRALYEDTVLPLTSELCEELSNWLAPRFGEDITIGFDKDQIEAIQENSEQKWKRYTEAIKGSIVTPNEAREALGYEAIGPEGDKLLGSVQMIPLDSISTWEQEADGLPEGGGNDPIESPGSDPGKKALGFSTATAKELHWKATERARSAFYGLYTRSVKSLLAYEMEERLAALEKDGPFAAVEGQAYEDEWRDLLTELHFRVATRFAENTTDELEGKAALPAQHKLVDAWTAEVRTFIATIVGDRVKNILDTSKNALRIAIQAGIDAGEGVFELSNRVKAVYEGWGDSRAERIARTEVISASNFGKRAAARATGVALDKEWVSTRDMRTRDTHRGVSGQRKQLDEPYNVGGEPMMFPCDSSMGASAENIVNCRCTEIYHVRED